MNHSLHNFDLEGLEKTLNDHGYMHKPSSIIYRFVEYTENHPGCTVLDMGCAFGVAAIPCLEKGANVIACDIAERHLEILRARTPYHLLHKLRTTTNRFPSETNFQDSSLDGVLMSHVLSFLTPDEIHEGINKIYRWLKQKRQLFVINYTPFHKTLKSFIPTYERQKLAGYEFPGLVEDRSEFCAPGGLTENLPKGFILFDVDSLSNVFSKAGFIIDECFYLRSKTEPVPNKFAFDGREWIAMIPTKP